MTRGCENLTMTVHTDKGPMEIKFEDGKVVQAPPTLSFMMQRPVWTVGRVAEYAGARSWRVSTRLTDHKPLTGSGT